MEYKSWLGGPIWLSIHWAYQGIKQRVIRKHRSEKNPTTITINIKVIFWLLGCLVFVWCFSSHSIIFHSYRDVTITGEGLQILTYAGHSWSLSSEGSLAFHTYCDTGHPFIMIITDDPWHSHLLSRVWQWSFHYLFLRRSSVAAGIRTPNLPLARRTL